MSQQSRRQFLQRTASVAAVGATAVLIAPLVTPLALPLAPSLTARRALDAQAQAATMGTPPPQVKTALSRAEVLRTAREKLYPLCRVCPECNGVACAGEMPGMGGVGTGASFKNNYTALHKLKVRMRVQHEVSSPSLAFNFFGQELALPVLGAPTGGVAHNMGGKMQEEEFVLAMLSGCRAVGSLGSVADNTADPIEIFSRRMDVLQGIYKGGGLVVIKPRSQQEIIARIRMAEKAGAVAFGVDVDSAGRVSRSMGGQVMEPKSIKQLEQLVKSTSLPCIVKGVMTVEEARGAVEAGAKGIVVSNHGGRVLDCTPGVAEVLPEIAAAVKGKIMILADGAVRHGLDVLKLLALGADACLVGRPLIQGAHGAGREGVALMLQVIKDELRQAMLLTGTESVSAVSSSLIVSG